MPPDRGVGRPVEEPFEEGHDQGRTLSGRLDQHGSHVP
jgi:hypothetical protein